MSGGSGKERRRKRKNVSERCVHFVKLSLVVFAVNWRNTVVLAAALR